jgi:hypothetical protein
VLEKLTTSLSAIEEALDDITKVMRRGVNATGLNTFRTLVAGEDRKST